MEESETPQRINFSIKGVPKDWFEQEFKPSAYNDFNDTYALKIMHDHDIVKTLLPRFEALLQKVEELERLIRAL